MLFGTDGIRGKANEYPMSAPMALKVGMAIGKYFRSIDHNHQTKILIGKDTRRSGYMLEQALGSGICSVGVDVLQLGPVPTPGIAYLTRGMRACAGIVISASHNPFEDNGIKIFSHDGQKLPDEVEAHLEKLLRGDDLFHGLPTGMDIGSAKRIDDAIGQYAVYLKEQFPKHLNLEKKRIVIDCANGAAYKVAPKVFSELGAELFLTGVDPNGENINDGCGALYPQILQEKVKLYKADIGFAFDGDADRVIICDDKGQLLDGDEILAVLAKYLHDLRKLRSNKVVSTIMSNVGLEMALQSFGVQLVRTGVGDRKVWQGMREHQSNLGGEQSGHIIYSDAATTGDGVLCALKILEAVIESGQPLSKLREVMTKMPQVNTSFKVSKRVPLADLPDLQKHILDVEEKLGSTGRVVFRYSGTEKKARLMLQGKDLRTIQTLSSDLKEKAEAMINIKGKPS